MALWTSITETWVGKPKLERDQLGVHDWVYCVLPGSHGARRSCPMAEERVGCKSVAEGEHLEHLGFQQLKIK